MRLIAAAALLALVACSRTNEGQAPQLDIVINPLQRIVSPARVCNYQGGENGWQLELRGSRFTPLPVDTLTGEPDVQLPRVTLHGPGLIMIPEERVFYVRSDLLLLNFPSVPETDSWPVPPGTYSVEVTNPIGRSDVLEDGLIVVAPPLVNQVVPPASGYSFSGGSPIVIEGQSFQPGTFPLIALRRAGEADRPLFIVNVVSDTRIETEVPPGTPEGTYDLVITQPEGCVATKSNALEVTYPRLGGLTLEPRFGWRHRNQAISLYSNPGFGFRSFAGGAPDVFLVAPLKTAPTELVEIPLRNVTFVSPGEVTAVVPTCSGFEAVPSTDSACPSGIAPGGPYAVRVADTSGAIGEVPAVEGFTVLEDPPPTLTGIAPDSVDTHGLGATSPLVVTGEGLGAGVTVQLVTQVPNGGGRVLVCDLPSTGTPSATEVRARVPASLPESACAQYTAQGAPVGGTNSLGLTLSPGLYEVRVRDTTTGAFSGGAGLVVTGTTARPVAGRLFATRLATPRADFPLVAATDDTGQTYVYAPGGITREPVDGTPQLRALASVEMARVTSLGDLSGTCAGSTCTFHTLTSTPLGLDGAAEPRRGHTAVVRTVRGDTSYVFLLGGVDESGKALRTVERAQVLRVADAPVLSEPTTGSAEDATLPAGTYVYRVSARLRGDDAKNPGGETLPSTAYSAKSLGPGSVVELSWSCLPGAASYTIYRTATANQPAGTEVMLTEVAATTCQGTPGTSVTFQDKGLLQPPQDEAPRPLPRGALGRWIRAAAGLAVERGQAATQVVGDDVYVTGGFCSTPGANCPSAGAVLDSIERATFTGDASAEGPWPGPFSVLGTSLGQARQRHSLAVAGAAQAPLSFASTSPDNRSDVWLLAIGGDTGAALLSNMSVARVRTASGGEANPVFTAIDNMVSASHGGWGYVGANGLFVSGNTGGTGLGFQAGYLCPTDAGSAPGPCVDSDSFNKALTPTGIPQQYQDGGSRYLNGNTFSRGFLYVAGGFPSDARDGAPATTVESFHF